MTPSSTKIPEPRFTDSVALLTILAVCEIDPVPPPLPSCSTPALIVVTPV
jgi:hypothetical protein